LLAATNAWLALPSTIRSHRDAKYVIDAGTGKSPEVYTEGGGCGVLRSFYITQI
jgi:hypothetical protein